MSDVDNISNRINKDEMASHLTLNPLLVKVVEKNEIGPSIQLAIT